MTGVRVRAVRAGEEDLWYAVRPPARGFREAFTSDADHRPETHLIALRAGVPVGRMDVILLEPIVVVLVHPVAADGADLTDVADALVAEGVRVAASLGAAETSLLLMTSSPRLEELLPRVARWGFVPQKVKVLYGAKAGAVRWDLGALPPQFTFRAAGSADDPLLTATFARVLSGSFECEDDATSELAEYAARCRRDRCLHVEDWEVLEDGGAPVGIVVPAFAFSTRDVATNLHVGLVPEARGRGLGAPLHLRGLATMRRRGAVGFIGSTDIRNVPMQHVFERVGYAQEATQHVFTADDTRRRSA